MVGILRDEIEPIYAYIHQCMAVFSRHLTVKTQFSELTTYGSFVRPLNEECRADLNLAINLQNAKTLKYFSDVYMDVCELFSRLISRLQDTFENILEKYSAVLEDSDEMFSLKIAPSATNIKKLFYVAVSQANQFPTVYQCPAEHLLKKEIWEIIKNKTIQFEKDCEETFSKMIDVINQHEKFFGDRNRLKYARVAFWVGFVIFILTSFKQVKESSEEFMKLFS